MESEPLDHKGSALQVSFLFSIICFLAAAGSSLLFAGLSLVVTRRGYTCIHGLLLVVASLVGVRAQKL